MSARKQVNQELTRDIIMDAARQLFTSKGYQHVSMRQIANKLGYSHGAIYYHFKNKAELFFALVEEHFKLLEQKLDEIVTQDIEDLEKIKLIMLGYIEFGITHQSHYEIMFLVKDEEVRNFLNERPMETYQKFANYLATYSEKQLTIQEIWSLFLSLHGFVTHYIRHVTNFSDVKGAANFHVSMLLKWTKK